MLQVNDKTITEEEWKMWNNGEECFKRFDAFHRIRSGFRSSEGAKVKLNAISVNIS